ncbi:hypothetical protein Tco_0960025 [Tanacetum coccineum]
MHIYFINAHGETRGGNPSCYGIRSSKKAAVTEDPDSEKSTSFTSMGRLQGSISQPGWGVTNNCRLDTPDVWPRHGGSHSNPARPPLKSSRNTRITGELSVCGNGCKIGCAEHKYFDEKLYPSYATVNLAVDVLIKHGLRLAVMKCAESIELRQAFADVVSAGIAKGMSDGLKHGVEHGKAKLDLAAIEAYDPEADTKYVVALHALKDLKYPLVDQLEKLKDAPIYLIMASLYLESDSGEDAPQWIRELRPSSSQLNIPVYPEVRNPKDPWSIKEEILLEDSIAANISRAEKKKKCRVVCVPIRLVSPTMANLIASQYQFH